MLLVISTQHQINCKIFDKFNATLSFSCWFRGDFLSFSVYLPMAFIVLSLVLSIIAISLLIREYRAINKDKDKPKDKKEAREKYPNFIFIDCFRYVISEFDSLSMQCA